MFLAAVILSSILTSHPITEQANMSVLVRNLNTGEVIEEHRANHVVPPASVMKLRNRGHLEQEGLAEQILFYRKRVQVDNSQLHNQQGYCFEGIHDIMRFHLHNFTTKMDDPTASINTLDEEGRLVTMEVPRTYTFHIVMQFLEQKSLNTEQRLFKITATRDGICSVEMR